MDIVFQKKRKSEFYAQELYSQIRPGFLRGGEIKMSCISSNFSSFFLDSLNDPSEFAKYLGNSENKAQNSDDQLYGLPGTTNNCFTSVTANEIGSFLTTSATNYSLNQPDEMQFEGPSQISCCRPHQLHSLPQIPRQQPHNNNYLLTSQQMPSQSNSHIAVDANSSTLAVQTLSQSQHNSNSFNFNKYLSNTEYSAQIAGIGETSTTSNNQLMDLDNTPPSRSSIRAVSTSNSLDADSFDHDSKSLYDIHNSNESGLSDQRISSNTSECSDSSNQANHPKPLAKFMIRESFEVHPAHKVEEGIFQHMNKLPMKKKETLKAFGVTFTGHMSVGDKSIIVDNFAKFCEEYEVSDHRPFLALNQSGMQKPEQIKFARYLGQGLPKFTLFCIYSNFKNMFCIKRFENYARGNYNLQYILEKTKKFLTCTTSDLKNLSPQMFESVEMSSNTLAATISSNGTIDQKSSKALEQLTIFDNFDIHESHRIEDGIFTHIGRLSPKKQELLKQFGIQSNHNVTYSEKCTIIENFIKFCREYPIDDHRPFLDFHESGLPKLEQIKFARYLGQGLPNLTLYKIYSAFKDMLALNRIEKLTLDGYNLEIILKKKRKNLIGRLNAVKRSNKEKADINTQSNPTQLENMETT